MDDTMTMHSVNEDVMAGKFLAFNVYDREFGIEIRYISEIIGIQDITPVPHTHPYLKGIINLRGTIVPVVDMRLRFGMPEVEYNDRTCIIVLFLDEAMIGLIVDEVQEVLDIDDADIQPPPTISSSGMSNYFIRAIGTVGASVKQLLDIERVFDTVTALGE